MHDNNRPVAVYEIGSDRLDGCFGYVRMTDLEENK